MRIYGSEISNYVGSRVGHGLYSSMDWIRLGRIIAIRFSLCLGDPKSDWSNRLNHDCISALSACLGVSRCRF